VDYRWEKVGEKRRRKSARRENGNKQVGEEKREGINGLPYRRKEGIYVEG
jgi:hypothetical protein